MSCLASFVAYAGDGRKMGVSEIAPSKTAG
jgi:hypothetical protein